MKEKTTKSGRSTLRPRARILRTFGDELISSDIVALIELVKNAYDADATVVTIRFFEGIEVGKGTIEVRDNGHGMDLETIQSTWMEPATLFRKRETYSELFKRRVLGEKGIGRFASSRLADSLEVVTRKKGSNIETKAIFHWNLFDNEEKYLDEIEVDWEETAPQAFPAQAPHGTILRMNGVRSIWNPEKLRELRRDLARLVSPFMKDEVAKGNTFTIGLDLPETLHELSGIIEPSEIIAQPHYVLKGTVKKSGAYTFSVELKGKRESKSLSGKFSLTDGAKPECGEFKIEFRVWDRDQNSLRDLANSYGSTLSDVREELNNAAGISVYRDGFRVLPYGERGNDWLRLDYRRFLNPTLRISNNQVVGYVSISADKNPQLRDQSNREGLIDSRAFRDFRELLINALSVLETQRYNIKPRKEIREAKLGGIFAELDLESIRAYAKINYPNDKAFQKLVGEKDSVLKERIDEVQKVLSRYRRLATLGQLIDHVLHDGRGPLSKIKNEAQLGKRDLQKKQNGDEKLLNLMGKRFIGIENNSDILSTLFKRIEPFGGRKRGRPSEVRLEDIIANAFGVLESEIKEIGANVDLPTGKTIVSVDEAEIQEVIINLLQNSLYWLPSVSKEKRKIRVIIENQRAGELKIIFSDSGPGVSKENQDRIFEPYFSTKPNGVGLGLTIAGEIVYEFYDGALELIDKGPLPGANFRITLRRRI